MVADIADALHFAHLQGIIHRDLKPQNILIDGHGKPRIADFGLAVTEEEQLREAVGALGTYAYMPPEVMNGGCNFADSRSDVYSMGSILYQLLTDRLLFPARTRDEWRVLILEKSPRLPSSIDDRIPAEIERVCLKCLSRNPSDRYTTARDLSCELRELVSAEAVLAFQAKQDSRAGSRNRSGLANGGRWIVPAAMLVAVIAVAVAFLVPGQRNSAVPPGPVVGAAPEVREVPPVSAEPAELIDFDQFPDQSELGILTGPVDTWIRALKKPPKILLMPADKRNSNIRYIRKESEVFLTTNDVGLLEIGETTQPDFDFQFKLKQNAWEGGIGAFVGYQDAPEHGLGHKRCVFIFLERIELLGSLQLVGTLSLVFIDQDGQILSADKVQVLKASRPNSAVLQNSQNEFKLKIRAHKLDSVSFDRDQSDFPHELKSKLASWASGSGAFGLHLARASGHFRNVHVRILSPKEANAKLQ
jgi:hypothetical protein